MSVTGGIKFLKQSKNKDATATSSISGISSVANLLDSNKETFWRSVSSSDSITEEITIEFSGDKTIDRLFLVDFNGKDFNIKFDLAGVFTDFSNVIGLNGVTQTTITETVFAQDTAYYEFTSVTTGKIRIQILKTQVANAEKFINQVVATEELSTLVGFPIVKSIDQDRSLRTKKVIAGKWSIQKSLEVFAYKLQLKNYPTSDVFNIDIDAILELNDLEDPFIVWLCGGRFGKQFFKFTIPGFRLKDVYQMQLRSPYKLSYTSNIYINQANIASVNLVEHI